MPTILEVPFRYDSFGIPARSRLATLVERFDLVSGEVPEISRAEVRRVVVGDDRDDVVILGGTTYVAARSEKGRRPVGVGDVRDLARKIVRDGCIKEHELSPERNPFVTLGSVGRYRNPGFSAVPLKEEMESDRREREAKARLVLGSLLLVDGILYSSRWEPVLELDEDGATGAWRIVDVLAVDNFHRHTHQIETVSGRYGSDTAPEVFDDVVWRFDDRAFRFSLCAAAVCHELRKPHFLGAPFVRTDALPSSELEMSALVATIASRAASFARDPSSFDADAAHAEIAALDGLIAGSPSLSRQFESRRFDEVRRYLSVERACRERFVPASAEDERAMSGLAFG